jgi:photosystem II stability/assembly factor-like uncharacterized protein
MRHGFVSLLLLASAAAQHWSRVDVRTTASLRGLSVVSDKIIWASGTDGTVVRTTDSGKSWSVNTVPGAEKLDFRGVHAFDANTAVIISSGPAEKGQARIYRTIDGGKKWTQVYEQNKPGIFFDAIAFWDNKNGIVLSDPVQGRFALFTTNDGGSSWKQIPAASLPPALPNEGAFAASNSCLTVHGKADVWFATGGANVARVFHSSDRGKTWTVAATPLHPKNSSSGIFSMAFVNSREGVAVGGDYQHPDSSDLSNVLRTNDGGKTWRAAEPTSPAGIYFSSASVDRNRTIVAGIKGLWIHSAGWKQASTENLNTVECRHGACWAVGPKGMVLKYSIADEDKSAHVPM